MTRHPLPPRMDTGSVFERNLAAWYACARLIIDQGGTSSGKTFSILQVLILIAICWPEPLMISVMSESTPHLKLGVIRDFQKIMGAALNPEQFNLTDSV